jgi:SAM-dependent methyltransferase
MTYTSASRSNHRPGSGPHGGPGSIDDSSDATAITRALLLLVIDDSASWRLAQPLGGHIDVMRRSMIAPAALTGWARFVDRDFLFADYAPDARVLDVGFGEGRRMRQLLARGCRAVGIEYDASLAARAVTQGLLVSQARAEWLPFASGSLDGLVCEVVLPYTDEARAVAEIGRVLRPGAVARLSCHGFGYALRSLATARSGRQLFYAARVVLNTWVYAATGCRLPGFVGDTLYQSRSRLCQYYESAGLELVEERSRATFAGAPVFLYHTVRRRDRATI